MNRDLINIQGFEEFQRKLKRLPDKLKRNEVLKIQRRMAKPLVRAYQSELPKDSGNLAGSVRAKTVSASKVGGNPSIQVLPDKKRGYDGYYKFMVVRKNTVLGSKNRGSRLGKNTVTAKARDRAIRSSAGFVSKDYEAKMVKYLQGRINKL